MAEKKIIDIVIGNKTRHVILSARTGTRRLTLRIDGKNRTLHVSHPPRCPYNRITEFIISQTDWINKNLQKIPERITFEPGKSVLFLGSDFKLIHIPSQRGIKVSDNNANKTITAECRIERFARAIELFMKREASETISYCAAGKAEKIGRNIKSLTIRDTKSRWGSCTSDGKLSFSWRLIMAPEFVLDYLVAHEVSHLIHMNHSAAFWRTCADLSHDMAGAKIWLRKNGVLLHRFEAN